MRSLIRGIVAVLVLAAVPSAAGAVGFEPPRVYGGSVDGVFRFPQAVAYDDSGVPDGAPGAPAGPYVYVADQYSFVVQKFVVTGELVRVWGGYGQAEGELGNTGPGVAATTGTVGGVGGLAVAANGDVYVLDSLNNRVQQFAPDGVFKRAFGQLGSAPGEFDTGINGGVAVFGDFLYVADQDNHRVQRFTLAADGSPVGEPVTFGSFGECNPDPDKPDAPPCSDDAFRYALNHPQGVAVNPQADGQQRTVYVADDDNHRVVEYTPDGGYVGQVGVYGTGDGEFRFPYDVSVDRSARLYVADNNNHRVQRFDAATLAFQAAWGGFGTGDGQLGFPRGLVALAAGDDGGVFVANTSNDRVEHYTAGGAFAASWGASGRAPGRFTIPRGVAIDGQNRLYVADTRTDRIQRFHPNRSYLGEWGARSSLGYPTSGDGRGEFDDVSDVAVDRATGEVWTVELGNHRVQRFTREGAWLATYGGTSAGSALGRFRSPLGVASGPGGELLVADTRNNRVQRRDPATGAWSLVPGTFARPSDVAVDDAGRVYVAEIAAGRVQILEPDGTTKAVIDGLAAPEGVAVDSAGRVYVADTRRDRVLIYRPAGDGYELEQQLGGRGAAPGRFKLPVGLAVDADGALYVADAYNNRIQKFPAAED
jgi:sugar lactone lactonase YvrE